jgi:hypothetical protein
VAHRAVVLTHSRVAGAERPAPLFRLRGGGVEGVTAGMSDSQLSILPGTNHMTIVERVDWLVPMVWHRRCRSFLRRRTASRC